jgi:hypothetical protein
MLWSMVPADQIRTLLQLMAATFLTCLLIAFFAITAPAETPVGTDDGPVPVPAAGQLYWGAWIDTHRTKTQPPWDMTPVAQVERQSGKGMSLLPFATPFADRSGTKYFEFPTKEFNTARAHGSIPFFSWSTHAMRRYSNSRFTLRSVIAGRHDPYIERWANAAKAWGHPFFLRFNWEMNGDWFPWSERYGKNESGQYVEAWRHVRRIFNRVGADNAAWVWCPAVDPYKTLQPLPSLYPGRAYVDWTCLDGYNTYREWKSFSNLVGSKYREITQKIAPGKPMIIGETASTETGGSKPAWLGDMFSALRSSYPNIRGLVYYDKDTAGPGGRRRLPLDSSSRSIAAFARGLSSSAVLSNNYQSLGSSTTRER